MPTCVFIPFHSLTFPTEIERRDIVEWKNPAFWVDSSLFHRSLG